MTDHDDQMEWQDQVWLDEVRDKQHLDRMWKRIRGEKVVRCEDCKYRQGVTCDYSAVYVLPNGYCNWGQRKEVKE